MATATRSGPSAERISIPWFGARKAARKLAREVQELRAERDTTREQLERFSVMGRELVAEVKVLRAQRELALKQFEKIGALSVAQLEFRRLELEREIAAQAARLEQEKSEAAAALQSMKEQLKKAH